MAGFGWTWRTGWLGRPGCPTGLIGWPISHAAWVVHADAALANPEPVTVLGIDETRRGRPVWVQDPVTGQWRLTERFETNFVLHGRQSEPAGTDRRAHQQGRHSRVTAWLDGLGQQWKDAVRIVAMDPCASYRAAVREALPNALIVADHFHLVRLANQAVTDVRRRVTWDTIDRRGRRATRPRQPDGGCCGDANASAERSRPAASSPNSTRSTSTAPSAAPGRWPAPAARAAGCEAAAVVAAASRGPPAAVVRPNSHRRSGLHALRHRWRRWCRDRGRAHAASSVPVLLPRAAQPAVPRVRLRSSPAEQVGPR